MYHLHGQPLYLIWLIRIQDPGIRLEVSRWIRMALPGEALTFGLSVNLSIGTPKAMASRAVSVISTGNVRLTDLWLV